jgi:hypothetical protein
MRSLDFMAPNRKINCFRVIHNGFLPYDFRVDNLLAPAIGRYHHGSISVALHIVPLLGSK